MAREAGLRHFRKAELLAVAPGAGGLHGNQQAPTQLPGSPLLSRWPRPHKDCAVTAQCHDPDISAPREPQPPLPGKQFRRSP